MQPLIPLATVLEGALLGAVDTSYIAKRTGLGIAIALAVIYGALVASITRSPSSEVHAVNACIMCRCVRSTMGCQRMSSLLWAAGSQSVLHMGLLGIWAGLASFLCSNTVCDTLRLMSPGSPLPVAIVPGMSDPPIDGDDLD